MTGFGGTFPGFGPDVDRMLLRARTQAVEAENTRMMVRCLADIARRYGKDGKLTFSRDEIAMMDEPQVEWTVDDTYRNVTFRVVPSTIEGEAVR